MREMLAKGIVPINGARDRSFCARLLSLGWVLKSLPPLCGVAEMMKNGEVDPKTHFGGPLSRHSQGIGTAPHAADGKPVDGFWNDVREDTMWNPDSDVSQAGQAIGAINDVPPAAFLVKTMMEELVATLQGMGKVRSLPHTESNALSWSLSLSLPFILVKRLCTGSCPRLCGQADTCPLGSGREPGAGRCQVRHRGAGGPAPDARQPVSARLEARSTAGREPWSCEQNA